MKTKFLFGMLMLILSIFVVNTTSAQGTIKGTVFNAVTKEAIPFANVYIKYGDQIIGAQSDFDGAFTIKPIPAGTYSVTFSCIGFGEKIISDVIIINDKITFLNGTEMSVGIDIPVVIIPANKMIDPEITSMKVIPGDVIKSLPNNGSINSIAAISGSDIQVSDDDSEIYFRGSRSGDVLYIIDGMRMINPKAFCPGLAIGNMAIYTGGVPAKYGDFTGGVIVIETASYFEWLSQQESQRLMNGGN